MERVVISNPIDCTRYNRCIYLLISAHMPRRITIHPHLSQEELETRFRQAKDATERTHYQTIWLLVKGKTTDEVAEVTGYGVSWIYELGGS